MKFHGLLSALVMLSVASAHTIMQAVNGNPQGYGIYMPANDGPQTDVNTNSMACNGPPIDQFRSSSGIITVQAGSTVTGAWLHTLTSTGPDQHADNKVIDSSHKGPVLAYMKKVSNAADNPRSGPGGGWFKIAHAGYNLGAKRWATDDLIAAGGLQRVTIPHCIANGDYLLRFELIALHSAYNDRGAQFYMECAQIRVTGGTGAKTPATVSFPGAYQQNHPGVKIMIWNGSGQPYPTFNYQIPGPAVFTC